MMTEMKRLVFLLALVVCAVALRSLEDDTVWFESRGLTDDVEPIVPPGTLDIEGNEVDASRVVKTLSVNNGGRWGDWGHPEFCPPGSFASGYNMKIEPKQYGGDDTSLNAIMILCTNSAGLHMDDATSTIGRWGHWGSQTNCEEDQTTKQRDFLVGFKLQVEKWQKLGDDTAANYVKFMCRGLNETNDHKYSIVTPPGNGLWGHWGLWSLNCPQGSAICGIQTKVENYKIGGDDTALNDVKFFCCSH